MRILLVNPNMSVSLTEKMTTIAASIAGPETEIIPMTAGRGFEYVASRAEAQIAGAIVYEMIAEQVKDVDAAIIAAFGDPGLRGAREIFDIPVVGMAEAALLSAAMLGERISIVTFSPVLSRWYTDSVADAGLLDRFSGVCTPPEHDPRVTEASECLRDDLIDLANLAVTRDGADVIVLGGAPLAGLSVEVQSEISAPVVDPISAATVQAMALRRLAAASNLPGRASKPIAKASIGLHSQLSRVIARAELS